MSEPLDDSDLRALALRGIDATQAREQWRRLREGFLPLDVTRPATLDDGILRVASAQAQGAGAATLRARAAGRVQRFVPASGAASRMFQSLLAVRHRDRPVLELDLNRAEDTDVARLLRDLERLPFAAAWRADARCTASDLRLRLAALLDEDGLGFARLPKGLIPFHRQGGEIRTAFEEQLEETARYADRVHFTVSADSKERIEVHLRAAAARMASAPAIEYSLQGPNTDTLAADAQGQPLRDADGSLLLRPGGHGALLHNLQQLAGDIVYLKNIDNVAPQRFAAMRTMWELLLGDLLLATQAEIFRRLHDWDRARPDGAALAEWEAFCVERLGLRLSPDGRTDAQRRERIRTTLERPLRVCAMVPNEGEPGGGPFWVRDARGDESLQIVEASQIDRSKPSQREALSNATHFNPVDLVCALRDAKGQPFDLARFVDPEAGFVSEKSKDGKTLRALELPGLWNGSMAHWNTLFVEVPALTFTPVKTVLDLLRPEHQSD